MFEKKIFLQLFSLLTFLLIVKAQRDAASSLLRQDICPGISATLSCQGTPNTTFTPVVTEGLYGVKSVESDLCEYTQGDCYSESTSSYCSSNSASCSIYASSSTKLPNCQNEIAEYLHIRYRCIPVTSNVIKNYNICNDTSIIITDEAGFISSPSYPTYVSVATECTRAIVVPSNKIINMWLFSDMKYSDSANLCTTDYLKILDSTGVYQTCGYRKYAYESKFCSSTIYISYKAPASLTTSFTGFRLYYETVDRSTQPDCSTATPPSPTTPAVTTTSTKPPPAVTDLVATSLIKITACKGEEKTISIPRNYLLFPINVYYGVTSDFTCNSIGPQNCRSPASLICNAPDSCKISLNTNVALADCGNKIASYIGAEYRFIPTVSTRNITLCDGNEINASSSNYSIITSPNYPNYQALVNCGRKIVAPQNRQIRIFINDLSIEPAVNNVCSKGYLQIASSCSIVQLCGDKATLDSNILTSCSNEVTITYVSFDSNNDQLRGFNIYYETITPDSALQSAAGACAGSSINLKCEPNPTTNFTVYFSEALYGIKSAPTNPCEFREGDCFEPSSSAPYCTPIGDNSCTQYASSYQILNNCEGKKADYLFTRYLCIPSFSTIVKDFNVCDKTLTDITDPNGFISSPNFPTYTSVNNECVQRIVAPNNKIIKMWIFVDIKYDSTVCATDYVKITDSTGTYKECSYRKVSYDKQLCSSVVYVSYYAPAVLSATSYKGFRIYYEFADRSTQPDCITATPMSPTPQTASTTTPQLVFDLAAKTANTTIVCRGNETTIDIPNRYILFPVDVYYGVTANGQCRNASLQDCRSPAQLLCSFNDKCTVSFYNDVVLPDCGGKIADYIKIEYRFIPPVTTRNVSICDASDLNLLTSSYGVMTNPNYPSFEPNKNCARTVLAPLGKVVRVYITDYYIGEQGINGECNNGYLELKSSCETRRYCGAKSNTGSYIFMSCTNFLSISYVSGSSNGDYRGFNIYYDVSILDAASSLTLRDFCSGDYASLTCDNSENTKFTAYVVESFYGIKSNTSQRCQYIQGDCIDAFSTDFCSSTSASCSISVPYYKQLPQCQNKYADYFHARYRCIPTSSTKIKQYDICSDLSVDITESRGFIQSPKFPSFTQVLNDCTRRIVAPNDKVIKAWIAIDVKSASGNNCQDDYIKITDFTNTYTTCGFKKLPLDNQLCSSVIYVSYKGASNVSSTLYKGLQLYYEFFDRSTQPDCPTGTPMSPTTPATTTTTPQVVFDLAASALYRAYACLGNYTTFQTPKDYKLYPVSVYYGVTKSGQCSNINYTDCRSPAPLNCQLEGSCTISLFNDVPVPDCSQGSSDDVKANYIGIDYRFIPFVSSKNFTVCETSVINANFSRYGIITNPNYPKWEPNKDCTRKIIAENGKIIRVYLNDFNIEQPNNNGSCETGYVMLRSDCSTVKYCGQKSVTGDYIFETCTNLLEISYKSSQSTMNDFRGFNLYYEATMADRASSQFNEITCVGTSRTLSCDPSLNTNFTVFMNEAVYGVKPAGTPTNQSCLFEPSDCFGPYGSACTTVSSNTCYMYPSTITTVPTCGNNKINYLLMRYKCVPITSSVMPFYNICDQNLGDITQSNGFITSPNYPYYQNVNGECLARIVAPSNKIVKIWLLELDIKSDTQCLNDYIMITDNTGTYKSCGFKKISYENELCSSVVYISYRVPSVLSSNLYKGFKLYYEFFDRSLQPSCSSAIPQMPSTAPTVSTTTQSTSPRPLVNNLSPTVILKTFVCKGESTKIQIPIDYQLFPINFYYGVTSNGTCRALSQQDCRSPAQLLCSLQGSCQVSLLSDISLTDCGGKVADYLSLEYRLIPLVSTRNMTMCSDNSNIILNATSAGVITSPGYPNYQTGINCNKVLVAPAGKIIRVYVNDVFLAQPNEVENCEDGYLSLSSDCNSVKHCGEKSSTGAPVFTTCGNTITINYVSSNRENIYRGFNIFYEVTVPDGVSSRLTRDICRGITASLTCETSVNTNFTIILTEVLNGIKSASTNACGYLEGDCYGVSTTSYCTSTSETCSITASSFTSVAKCNDKTLDYAHVRYRCVPYTSNVIREYNVCDRTLKDIIDDRGFISSPSYPTFVTVDQECTVKIKAPLNKIINVWLPDVYIKSPEPNNDCVTDYIKIVHGTGTLKACGNKKYQFDNRICSSEVFINYKAPNRTSGFKGFKLYYEFADRSAQPNCPTDAPTTTLSTPSRFPETTTKHLIQDLMASEIKHEYICKGEKKTIEVPNDFLIFPINYYYGVSSDSKCTSISENDCKSAQPFTYLTDSNIEISFYNDIALTEDCSGADATYIGLEYRFIPRITSQNYSVCDNHELKLKDSQYGVITSPNYPNWVPNERCMMRLVAPQNKIIRVYINDLNTEIADENGECSSTHLSLMSGNNIPTRYCGDKSQYGDYVYLSCSETLEVYYRSSSIVSENYRGFHLYFEVIDKNNVSCGNVTMAPFTRTTRTTRHVTLYKDETHSSHLTGWSLGLGIPLLIVVVFVVIFMIKRMTRQESGEQMSFSKLKNSDANSNFYNPNFLE